MTIRWVLEKKESATKLGITFRGPKSENSNDIHPTFVWTAKGAKKIDIVPGLRISKICDKWVRNAEHAEKIVWFAPAGPVTVETYGKYFPMDKTTKDEKAGIALYTAKFPILLPNGVPVLQEVVEITKVNSQGMFAEVTPGHILWGINGTKITNPKQAIKMLRKKKSLRLVVLDPATLDTTIKNVVSKEPTSEPMPSDPVPEEEEEEEPVPPQKMPTSPVTTVLEKSFETEEDDSSVYDDESSVLVEGDEEFGPTLWC